MAVNYEHRMEQNCVNFRQWKNYFRAAAGRENGCNVTYKKKKVFQSLGMAVKAEIMSLKTGVRWSFHMKNKWPTESVSKHAWCITTEQHYRNQTSCCGVQWEAKLGQDIITQ